MQEAHRWTGEILKPKSTTGIILDQHSSSSKDLLN